MAEEPTGPPRGPVGTRDVLWPESARWEQLVARFARRARLAGYGLLVTPVLEEARLFRRGVGEASEVVTKEMYELTDRGGRHLALRPEGTAPVVRAFVQHNPPVPYKAWYVTPAFRYERPQAGRYRQHHQLGVEALGSDDPDLDVEVIALAAGFYVELGLSRVALAVNSMGCGEDRPAYLSALRAYLDTHAAELCDEHRERYGANPLRVLDCKRPACMAVTAGAPRLVDFLDAPCAAHFARVRAGLDALGVHHHLEPRLVRGLDYYTRTTFEFSDPGLESAQNAVGGGGRYDGLAEAIGGKPAPGVGFGIGIERLLLACDAEAAFAVAAPAPEVFVVDLTGGEEGRDLAEELRRAGLAAVRAFDDRSLKAQLRLADRSGARWAAVVGPAEKDKGTVQLKDLRGGSDRELPRDRLVAELSGGEVRQ
ncbi:MAG TPA: histidine--tRNA ligase [Acidimicrobiaceae bacterium]|nr:histidine--tRNA ligase [Acidimicrobiaceae bacterium]